MNKLFMWILMFSLIFINNCGEEETPLGPPPEPELVGCEAADVYDWDSVEFSATLDQGQDTWIAFSLEEITLFSVFLDQTGFQCSIYSGCDGAVGAGEPLFQFESIGNGVEIGIVPLGDYWLNLVNTRNRADFTFRIDLNDIVYGCMNNDAINYDDTANIDDGNCLFNDCTTDYWTSNFGDMILDCDGNCAPASWVGDDWCDDGAYSVVNEEGEEIPVNLWCDELNFDEGDCEVIVEDCTEGEIEDCNGICAPEEWVGDGFCDDGSYQHNGNAIFFNCEEFSNDNGDCDVMGRTTQQRQLPNGRIYLEK